MIEELGRNIMTNMLMDLITLRNFYAEYHGKDGFSYNKVFQLGNVATLTDKGIFEYIKGILTADGYDIYLLAELWGDYELQEVARVFRENDMKFRPYRIIYIDREQAAK